MNRLNQVGQGYKDNSGKLEESIRQLNEQIREKDAPITRYTVAMHPGVNSKETGTKYFLSEIMMTAGPRKPMKNNTTNDMDLGEDVCGFVMTGDEALVWILDGASDYTCLRSTSTKENIFQAVCSRNPLHAN